MSSRRLPRSGVVFALLTLLSVVWGVSAFARVDDMTIFAKLEHLEAKAYKADARATSTKKALTSHDARIHTTLEEYQVAKRATVTLREQLVSQQIAWQGARRRLTRQQTQWKPQDASDIDRLLTIAQPKVLSAHGEHHDMLDHLSDHARKLTTMVLKNGSIAVELAQHRATATSSRADHARALTDAKKASASTISRDLRKTTIHLSEHMETIRKNPSSVDFHRSKGTLVHPVRHRPDHIYGPRKQRKSASYVRHTGYTYLVPKGTPVRAVGAGMVVFAQRFEGFGRMIIIDHGTGYHSIYAHLDEFLVKPGQKVRRSTPLAKSGESGSLEGPKFYFELRKKGEPVNPKDWFVRLK